MEEKQDQQKHEPGIPGKYLNKMGMKGARRTLKKKSGGGGGVGGGGAPNRKKRARRKLVD